MDIRVDGVGVGESRAAHKECPKQPFSQCLLICQRMRSAGKCRLRALNGRNVSGLARSTHLPFKNPCNFFFTQSASINERQVTANPSPNSHNGPPEEEQEGCQQHQLQVGACYEVRKGYAQSPEMRSKPNFGLTSFAVTLGYKSTLKSLRSGKAKLIIIAGNTPPLRKSELEYYSMLSKAPIHHFSGNNVSPKSLGLFTNIVMLRETAT